MPAAVEKQAVAGRGKKVLLLIALPLLAGVILLTAPLWSEVLYLWKTFGWPAWATVPVLGVLLVLALAVVSHRVHRARPDAPPQQAPLFALAFSILSATTLVGLYLRGPGSPDEGSAPENIRFVFITLGASAVGLAWALCACIALSLAAWRLRSRLAVTPTALLAMLLLTPSVVWVYRFFSRVLYGGLVAFWP